MDSSLPTTLVWYIFIYFQCIVCIFGVFSHFLFIFYLVLKSNIHVIGRYHLLFQSIGYLLIVISFIMTTGICFTSIFDKPFCTETTHLIITIHTTGESFIVIFHFLLNADRLKTALYPYQKASCEVASLFVAIEVLGHLTIILYLVIVHYFEEEILISLIPMFIASVLNAIIVHKLYSYSTLIFRNTRGVIPLGKRFDLYQSLKIIRSLLPASIIDFCLILIIYVLYIIIALFVSDVDKYSWFLMINIIWVLDCSVFPWFFLSKNPKVMRILRKLLRSKVGQVDTAFIDVHVQDDHFKQLQDAWRR